MPEDSLARLYLSQRKEADKKIVELAAICKRQKERLEILETTLQECKKISNNRPICKSLQPEYSLYVLGATLVYKEFKEVLENV